MPNIVPGRYTHFKGGRYLVLANATHSETEEPLVVYISLETGVVFVRPSSMWADAVTWPDGLERPRFVYEDPDEVRHSISTNLAR